MESRISAVMRDTKVARTRVWEISDSVDDWLCLASVGIIQPGRLGAYDRYLALGTLVVNSGDVC
jgi:hypothetical protein